MRSRPKESVCDKVAAVILAEVAPRSNARVDPFVALNPFVRPVRGQALIFAAQREQRIRAQIDKKKQDALSARNAITSTPVDATISK